MLRSPGYVFSKLFDQLCDDIKAVHFNAARLADGGDQSAERLSCSVLILTVNGEEVKPTTWAPNGTYNDAFRLAGAYHRRAHVQGVENTRPKGPNAP